MQSRWFFNDFFQIFEARLCSIFNHRDICLVLTNVIQDNCSCPGFFHFCAHWCFSYIWHANSLNTLRWFIGEKETCGETRVCDALSLGCTRLVRLSIICIRVVHVLYVHMWRIIYVLETNMPCVIGRDDGSVCLFISTNRCYYLVGEAFRFSYPDSVSCYSTCVSLFIMTCVVSFQI